MPTKKEKIKMSKYTINQAKNVIGSTDWKTVEHMTDQEVRKAAMSDKDAQPLNFNQLKQFKKISTIKNKLGL